ncbi:wd repeat containing protein 48 [Moniliophthora roreri]|nr:wd repeat containing protein 48 [Moniliophthora roreri]
MMPVSYSLNLILSLRNRVGDKCILIPVEIVISSQSSNPAPAPTLGLVALSISRIYPRDEWWARRIEAARKGPQESRLRTEA